MPWRRTPCWAPRPRSAQSRTRWRQAARPPWWAQSRLPPLLWRWSSAQRSRARATFSPFQDPMATCIKWKCQTVPSRAASSRRSYRSWCRSCRLRRQRCRQRSRSCRFRQRPPVRSQRRHLTRQSRLRRRSRQQLGRWRSRRRQWLPPRRQRRARELHSLLPRSPRARSHRRLRARCCMHGQKHLHQRRHLRRPCWPHR